MNLNKDGVTGRWVLTTPKGRTVEFKKGKKFIKAEQAENLSYIIDAIIDNKDILEAIDTLEQEIKDKLDQLELDVTAIKTHLGI
jgi:hypothetical protein